MTDKVIEIQVGEDLTSIVAREVLALKKINGPLEYPEILRLEKLAKIYSILSANGRENTKANIYGTMSTEQLEKLLDSGDDADDGSDHT